MATFEGVGSPFALNLQDFDKDRFNSLQKLLIDTESRQRADLDQLRRNTSNALRSLDKDIQIGSNLVGSLSKELTLNKQGYEFDINNLQDQYENYKQQNELDFEKKMSDFAFKQEQQNLNFQKEFDAISFRADQTELGYDRDIAVLTARLEAEKDAIEATAKGNKAVLEAQIKAAEVGRRAQQDIISSLETTKRIVEEQGQLAIRHANLQGQIAFVQERALKRRGRFSRFKFQEARAVRQATLQAEGGLAESSLLNTQGEQILGAQFEAEMTDVVAGVEQARARQQQAVIGAKSAEKQTELRKEGIGRQIIQSDAQYKKLGFAIEGYRARINAIDQTVKKQTQGADETLRIRRDYAGKMKKRAKDYFGSAKQVASRMHKLQSRMIAQEKGYTEANYALQKSRTDEYFDRKMGQRYFGYMNSEMQLNRNINKNRQKLEYANMKRSDLERQYRQAERQIKKNIDDVEYAQMRLEANEGTPDEGTIE